MLEISGYKLNEKIYESKRKIIYRAIKEKDNIPVIIKILKSEFPLKSDLEQLEYEYRIMNKMNISGVIRYFSIENIDHSKALIMEDIGGISLDKYLIKHKIDIKSFLKIAIDIVKAIDGIHKNNIIHKDIKPHNIIINETTEEIKIIDFSIASIVKRELQENANVEKLEGTLSYISPEQTGRMNRFVDYRTDYYSLGITFYEMLTGKTPFEINDTMEMIHSHIAINPISVKMINLEINETVSNIVMKLLSKTAEERYQSSQGLIADLDKCYQNMLQHGKITDFKIGENDISNQFHISEKLYGRENEVEILFNDFKKVTIGERVFTLVAGSPGIGKSFFIQEIQKPLVKEKGYFISGKFDQFKRNMPYYSIIEAFHDLISQILSETEENMTVWKKVINESLGSNGGLIADIIPEIEFIIGKQKEVPELSPGESENRFNYVFQNFIKVFANKYHPLIIFLDDLQWADSASLKLINNILQDESLKYFFLIGSYRDTEVDNSHPLMMLIEGLRKADIKINTIMLDTLDSDSLDQLIADTLCRRKDDVSELSLLVKNKTKGNPFFVNEFLKNLYDEKHIWYENGWEWDLSRIENAKITDNVVDFMIQMVQKFDERTQNILKIGSIIGMRFNLLEISEINGKSIDEIFEGIKESINEGMIIKIEKEYRFAHDRVREAVYSLIKEKDRLEYHYKVGRIILSNTAKEKLEDRIFDIVEQLNNAISIMTDSKERIELAELNLKAGIKAKESTAYEAAVKLLKTGIDLLPTNSWDEIYDLTFNLNIEYGESEFLQGNHEKADKIFENGLLKAINEYDKARIYMINIPLLIAKGTLKEALQVGRKALFCLGIKTPDKVNPIMIILEFINVNKIISKRKIESLIDLPIIDDPRMLAIEKIFGLLISPSYLAEPEYFPIIVLKGINFILNNGNSIYSPYIFTVFGIIQIAAFKNFKTAYQFGELAINLERKINAKIIKSKIYYTNGFIIKHWLKNIKECIPLLEEGYKAGIESGDLEFVSYNLNGITFLYLNLENLNFIYEKYQLFYKIMKKFNLINSIITLSTVAQFAITLNRETDNIFSMDGEIYNEKLFLQIIKKNNDIANMNNYYYFKQILHYIYNDFKTSIKYSIDAKPYLNGMNGMIIEKDHYFFQSLAMLGNYPNASKKEQKSYIKTIHANKEKLKKWSSLCPENVEHKYLLVEAELAAVTGNYKKAMSLYNQSIMEARKNRFIQDEAIANECAGKFYLSINQEKIASLFITGAYLCYESWGAVNKTNDLLKKHGNLIRTEYISSSLFDGKISLDGTISLSSKMKKESPSSSSSSTQILDLNTVMKASYAISGEIEMEKLLKTLIKIVMENAGAEISKLMIIKDNQLYLMAQGKAGEESQIVESIPIENSQLVPQSIVRYVLRTKESIVLQNAMEEGQYTKDQYIVENKCKSVLCTPIINQGKIIGIFFLENNLSNGAFTKERLSILSLLAGQIGISLENAKMIEEMKEKARLQQEMEIAERIQTSLLPKEIKDEELEITGIMVPTEEVGGDYYDYIRDKESNLWFAIGDVSGHGVTTGLLMMMAETIFNSTIDSIRNITPKDVINEINNILYKNIQSRMKENYFMTCCVIKYSGKGNFIYSGFHLDILIYRNKKKKCELVKTDGIFLGIRSDIIDTLVDREFLLEKGDIMVLYTDGVIESMKEVEGKLSLWGIENLCKVIEDNNEKSIEEIKELILKGSLDWCNNNSIDDITIIVVKRK
ncbi:MAG: hypothetical protein A2086_07510 [Spirochaetes bacterium GWD1_27_9]|nr:MAG: hypothetical protein A2Z98_18155 [Spirochaetes bacterium GWB1_27_13]OHD27953.1 MAG: hypothetical protein A2Y34_13345 [Spirochaetes bacterium GWC1_27_15]OHD44779.1 MAG: hypothetical protein A2086_07510 [Spirochaetes bacterium GWD1_27_9]